MPSAAWTLRPIMDGFVLRVAVLLGVVLLAAVIGLVLRARAGRSRDVEAGELLSSAELAAPLGERATFVQFSSPACSSCRSVRRILTGLVADEPGLAHVEIDATERLDLARRLGILRTPTVLLLDPEGIVVRRISGPLTAEQALAAVPNPIRSQS
jgi:thiol-disulfide isomerase/thioredoxin